MATAWRTVPIHVGCECSVGSAAGGVITSRSSTLAGGVAPVGLGLVHTRTEPDDAATARPIITAAAVSQTFQVARVADVSGRVDVTRPTLGRSGPVSGRVRSIQECKRSHREGPDTFEPRRHGEEPEPRRWKDLQVGEVLHDRDARAQ